MLFGSQVVHVLKYGRSLSQLGHSTVVIPLIPSVRKTEYEKLIAQARVHATQSKMGRMDVHPIFLKATDSRILTLLNPTVFFKDFGSILKVIARTKLHTVICFYVPNACPLVILKRFFGFSLAVVATGGDVNLEKGILRSLVRRLVCRNTDFLFAMSGELKDKLKRETGRDPILIPTGVDTSLFKPNPVGSRLREKWGFKQNDAIVLTVCNLVRDKGVDVLIRSIGLLNPRQRRRLKLVIVGGGPERIELQRLVSELGLDEHVFFLGFVGKLKEEELLELYNITNAFVLASYSEGLPSVLLEAMACRCVCIATNVGDVSKVIHDGHNGFIVDPGDSQGLAERIERALSLPSTQLDAMQNHARRTVMEKYDVMELCKRMTDLVLRERENK